MLRMRTLILILLGLLLVYIVHFNIEEIEFVTRNLDLATAPPKIRPSLMSRLPIPSQKKGNGEEHHDEEGDEHDKHDNDPDHMTFDHVLQKIIQNQEGVEPNEPIEEPIEIPDISNISDIPELNFTKSKDEEYLVMHSISSGYKFIPLEKLKDKNYNICEKSCGRYLTVVNNYSARFGHYYATWRGSYLLSLMANLTYIHHEFSPKNDVPAEDWEKFLGLGENLEDYSAICVNRELKRFSSTGYLSGECKEFIPCLKIVRIPRFRAHTKEEIQKNFLKYIDENQDCNTVFHLTTDQIVSYHFTNEPHIPQYFDFVRQSYRNARKRYPIRFRFDPTQLNIGVHIRRGDVSDVLNTENRFIPNSSIYNLLKSILAFLFKVNYQTELNKKGYQIHIYSEGVPEDFGEIQNLENVQFHLNEDLFETLDHLMRADIFVGSFSGFSTYAKIMARGIPFFPFIKSNGVEMFPKGGTFKQEEFQIWWDKLKPILSKSDYTL